VLLFSCLRCYYPLLFCHDAPLLFALLFSSFWCYCLLIRTLVLVATFYYLCCCSHVHVLALLFPMSMFSYFRYKVICVIVLLSRCCCSCVAICWRILYYPLVFLLARVGKHKKSTTCIFL
jgi:hypothetical protein